MKLSAVCSLMSMLSAFSFLCKPGGACCPVSHAIGHCSPGSSTVNDEFYFQLHSLSGKSM